MFFHNNLGFQNKFEADRSVAFGLIRLLKVFSKISIECLRQYYSSLMFLTSRLCQAILKYNCGKNLKRVVPWRSVNSSISDQQIMVLTNRICFQILDFISFICYVCELQTINSYELFELRKHFGAYRLVTFGVVRILRLTPQLAKIILNWNFYIVKLFCLRSLDYDSLWIA